MPLTPHQIEAIQGADLIFTVGRPGERLIWGEKLAQQIADGEWGSTGRVLAAGRVLIMGDLTAEEIAEVRMVKTEQFNPLADGQHKH